RTTKFKAVQIGTDRFEVLSTQRERQSRRLFPKEDPLQIWILRRRKVDKRMASALQKPGCQGCFGITEVSRISPKPLHYDPGEEDFEEAAPNPSIPLFSVESSPLDIGIGGLHQKTVYRLIAMNQREDIPAKESQVLFEASDVDGSALDCRWVLV